MLQIPGKAFKFIPLTIVQTQIWVALVLPSKAHIPISSENLKDGLELALMGH